MTSPADAHRQLLEEAEQAAVTPPGSVTDKAVPGGIVAGPHDFVSIGRYSWPNPDTTDGLPWVRRDCVVNEAAYAPEFDLTRYKAVVDNATTLALAYRATGTTRFADAAAAHLSRWFLQPETAMRPHLAHAAVLPGANNGTWYGIIQGAVMARIPFVAAAIADSEAWTATRDQGLRRWFGDYVQWLETGSAGRRQASEGKDNNTMLWFHTQRAVFGRYAGAKDVVGDAMERLAACCDSQIAPDGSLPAELERPESLVYSVYWHTAAVTAAALGPLHGVDLWNRSAADGRSLRTSLDHLAPFLLGRAPWPWPHTDDRPPEQASWVYALAARVYGDTGYQAVSDHVAEVHASSPAHIHRLHTLLGDDTPAVAR